MQRMMTTVVTSGQVCPKCKLEKPSDRFYRKETGHTYCKDCSSETAKKRFRVLKQQAMEAYGGQCACCGESELAFLCIDHINNDGNEHRRQIKARTIYGWLRKNNYPDGFQVLCWNCNAGKHINGGICPHVTVV